MNDIYLIYLRKSRADNPDETVEEVLARHERQLQEHAIKLLGKRVDEKYIFREVVSGETIEDRPEIKKVLAFIEDINVKGVLVIEPQRLSRGDWEDGGKILTSFKYSNTLVITPQKTYDLNNKFDYKFFKMELSQGNDYLEYIKEILIRGRIASVKEGNYIGSVAPYGYKKIYIDNKPTLEIYEPEAEIIRYAVDLRLNENIGWAKIAHKLDQVGFKPRKGDNWNPYTLKDICLNPVNNGMIKWNTRKTKKVYEDGKIKKTRPRNRDDVIYIPGKHEKILSDDVFNKLINNDRIMPRENKTKELVNPFAGLIYCGNCGKAMTYRTYKNRDGSYRSAPRLLCNNQVHCGTKSSNFEIVYNAVIDTLEMIVEDFKMKMANDETKQTYDINEKLLQEAQKSLDKLETRQNELYDLLENHIYTKEVFLKRNKKLADERTELKKQIEHLKNNIHKPINYEEKIIMFSDVIKALKSNDISAQQKNILLKNIIDKIEYTRDSRNRTKWDTSKPKIKIKLKDF